ncbi:hypothetical protein HanRHA438_Chr11g0511771 [Helianthus annuus]|nr:hypothetical protein HanHA300_Chr11g0409661 [Helianthus annuus]KAJ0518092.1 hypothetical protein HanHA89_Chr11g0433331 [Helianthus annuus]KAJ0686118.1 hypothetical protein HanLR1_Chr11g0410931 [Helianthus annuus]KAJ0871390.1 hypothetical protein HanRHA438_Chr11g0511771 [Helianthus annuus]
MAQSIWTNSPIPSTMESYSGSGGVPSPLAIVTCIGMTMLYVAILHLPPPFHLRFTCFLRLYSSCSSYERVSI